MITMVIFVLVIMASSQIFTALLTQFKQQSTIAETNIEGVVGLDILRRDLAHAGFGLPWVMNGATYTEAVAESGQTFWVDRELNDGPPNNPIRGADQGDPVSNPPAAFRTLNGDCNDSTNLNSSTTPGIHDGATGSKTPKTCADVLAIKSTNVAMNDAAQRWSYITNRGSWNTIMSWGTGNDAPQNNDFISIIAPIDGANQHSLKWTSGSAAWTTYGDSISPAPADNSFDTYVIYGLGNDATPKRPFNRADYYVKRPASGMPSRCAPHTGILYKAFLNQSNGLHTETPLLDCVIDFQVEFQFDASVPATSCWQPVPPSGDKICNDISHLTAADIRGPLGQPPALREVRVYIVAQEGRRDTSYDFSREAVSTIEMLGTQSQTRPFVNLKNAVGDPEYKYYRWKLYTLTVKPTNLR